VLSEVVTAGTTTTQLTGVNGANVGQTVTFSAVVTPSSTSATYAPSSTVQFSVDSSPVGSPVPLYFISANNEGYALYEAQYSTSSLSVGTHTITAQYAGDVNYPVPSVSNPQTIIISGGSSTAVLYFPAPSSTLTSTNVNFKWLPGSTATQYWIDVGSSAGGNNYYQSGPLTTNNLGAVVDSLPNDGSTVYVTLYSFISGSWVSTPYTYNAVGGTSKAAISSPTAGSNLCGSCVTFTWNAVNPTPAAYWLEVTDGPNIYYNASVSNATTSVTVCSLPTDGSTVTVTLWTNVGTGASPIWISNQYTYYASNAGTTLAVMSSPSNGTPISGTTATFTWTISSAAAACGDDYWMDIQTDQGTYQSGNLGSVSTFTPPSGTLPNDGSNVTVVLYTTNPYAGPPAGYTVLGNTQDIYPNP